METEETKKKSGKEKNPFPKRREKETTTIMTSSFVIGSNQAEVFRKKLAQLEADKKTLQGNEDKSFILKKNSFLGSHLYRSLFPLF